ncbi:MAG: hypothetical protein DHS20C07_18410 [Methyloligella sp.]|nr:MAG: hypothetical protein DHS20C07_18410 [Methyloligella sp.]
MIDKAAYENVTLPKRNIMRAVLSGFSQKCPNCNKGSIFGKFLKVNHQCSACGEELHHHRADDAPPYFTIFVVGHVILPLMMAIEIAYMPAIWIHVALWLPMTLLMCAWLLPRIKGALIGVQWANYMHGFNPHHNEADEYPTSQIPNA